MGGNAVPTLSAAAPGRLSALLRALRRAGLRATRRRRQLLAAMAAHGGWMSADALAARLRRAVSGGVAPSVVYHAVRALAAAGVAEAIAAPVGRARALYALRGDAAGRMHYWAAGRARPAHYALDGEAHAALRAFFARMGIPVQAYYVVARGPRDARP